MKYIIKHDTHGYIREIFQYNASGYYDWWLDYNQIRHINTFSLRQARKVFFINNLDYDHSLKNEYKIIPIGETNVKEKDTIPATI